MAQQGSGYLARPAPSGLADVVEIVLDKGIVIDAYLRVSVIGIELLTVDARIVIASVDTYLRFAEATNRLDLEEQGGTSPADLLVEGAEQLTEKVATAVVQDKVEGVVEPIKEVAGGTVEKVVDTARDLKEKAGELVEKAVPEADR